MVVPGDPEANGGLGNHMWAVVVDRAGVICTVTRSGETFGDQWPGSRSIAGEGVHRERLQPAGLRPVHGESVLADAAREQPVRARDQQPRAQGGVLLRRRHVMGHRGRSRGRPAYRRHGRLRRGLALYDAQGELVGGFGVSSDESCTDHIVAWKVRHASKLDNVPAGVTKADDDNIIHDLSVDPAARRLQSASGYGHPTCSPRATTLAENLSETLPTGPEE